VERYFKDKGERYFKDKMERSNISDKGGGG